ncbi:MAG: alcohol dehydrogenase catalytic domain-containing protein [bacterium]
MLQAKMTKPVEIVFEEVPIPGICDNEVLLKVRRIGVCGSDIHVYHGKHPYTSYPVIQGHELSGEIVEAGGRVKDFGVGDFVTIQPQVTCGRCPPCIHGNYHICDNLKVMGFQTDGGAREYFAVDERKVIKLPESMSFDEGAMIEPTAVAVHALKRAGDVTGKKILILGAGPIGNLVAQVARGKGAAAVMITDVSEFRLNAAEKCNIEYRVNAKNSNLEEELRSNFGEEKADLILECVGINETIDQAIMLARKGTDIIVVGVFGSKVNVDLGLVQDKELRLIGTLMYQREDFIEAIDLVKGKKINVKELITDYFDFRDYSGAYMYIDEKKDRVMKVMIVVNE